MDEFKIEDNKLIEYLGEEEYIFLPKDVSVIGEKAFSENEKIKVVTIPEGVTCIERFAFSNCKNLKEIYLPYSLVFLDSSFINCDNIVNVYYSGSKKEYELILSESFEEQLKVNVYCHYKISYKIRDFESESYLPTSVEHLNIFGNKKYIFRGELTEKTLIYSNNDFKVFNLKIFLLDTYIEVDYVSSGPKSLINSIRVGADINLTGIFVYSLNKDKIVVLSKKINCYENCLVTIIDKENTKHIELHTGVLDCMNKEDIILDYVEYIKKSNISSMAFILNDSIEHIGLISKNVKEIIDFKPIYGVEFKLINDIDNCLDYNKIYNVCLLATNKLGLKNIYKLLLYSLNNGSMITTSLLQNNKDCILTGLVISEDNILTEEEIEDIIDYVDYLEVVPENKYWVNMESFLDNDKNFLKNIYNAYWTINQENILFIIDICKQKNKLITCSSKCKYVHSIYKEYHELYTGKEQPFQHIRLTRELLEYFNFLDEELAYEIVVTNTNKIAEMIEKIDL